MPEEEICGAWILDDNGQVMGDDSERRIGELIEGCLRIADREGGWTILFRNPLNGTYWELTYPHSEMHGGGPRKLSRLSRSEVTDRYPIISTL
jgi:immunity protein 27 of polymorphic toxin system